MVRRLGEKALKALNKRIPPMKPKAKNVTNPQRLIPERSVSTERKIIERYAADNSLVRTPAADTVEIKGTKITSSTKRSASRGNSIGDIWYASRKEKADIFLEDLETIVKDIPGAVFIPEYNQSSAKEVKRILAKIEERNELFAAHGFNATVRDGIRGTIFLPEADKNYMQVIERMKKVKRNNGKISHYEVADTLALDKNKNVIYNSTGKPVMVKDIDIRFGENAVPSGYEDVQLRFQKGNDLYELIILPGPHYASFKNKEHKMIFENFRDYEKIPFANGEGAKQIIKALKKEFHSLTKRLYKDALSRDMQGSLASSEPITFSKENVTTINKLFKDLKNMYNGHYSSLPPSKRLQTDFRQTKTYMELDKLEQNLREVIKEYKPID